MTLVVNDRVQEVSTSTGSGPFVLGGGVTGYQTFSVGIGNTNSTYYTITNGTNWMDILGTYTSAANSITVDKILTSSAGGTTAVSFAAGTKNVFCTYPAATAVLAAPAAYPTIQPTLNLDFANTRQLDPRITFVRNSTAAYYDGQTSAMAEQNLLSYSQDFSNGVWIAGNGGSKTSTTTLAPDGTSTAVTVSLPAQFSNILHATNSLINGTTYTISFYARRDSGTNVLSIYSASGFSIGTYTPTTTWVRYAVSFTWSNPTTSTGIYVAQDRNTTGFSDIQIWGAQLEQRSSATAYTPTTTAAITNYIPVLMTAPAGVARFDCDPITGKSLGLLIEESRVNLFTYSSDFSNGVWNKYGNPNCTYDTAIAPDGTLTADLIPLVTGASGTQGFFTSAVTTTQVYTHSIYIKPLDSQLYFALLNFDGLSTSYNLSTMQVSNGEGGTSTGTITAVGNGWYRLTRTVTSAGGTQYPVCIAIPSYPRSGGVTAWTPLSPSRTLFWGAQLEAGSFATSYIPTVASTVTRAADTASMTGTNFSSWYNQSQGSLYVEAWSPYATGALWGVSASLNDGVNNYNNIYMIRSGAQMYAASNGSALSMGSAPGTSMYKAILSYKPSLYVSGVNGVTTTYTTLTSVSATINKLSIGNAYVTDSPVNGWVRKLSYYPVALSSANLVALTF